MVSCVRFETRPHGYVLPKEEAYYEEQELIIESEVVRLAASETVSFKTGSNLSHQVAPGETVWRLAKIYNVKAQDIISANSLKSATDIKMGQRLIIPNASSPKEIIPLFPSKKWQYIIIHHSATDEGNSLHFNKAHTLRGWDRGVGYDFVIDNGTSGKREGQIETTPRWIKQQDGAHCKASDMNKKAIGICLVGNFSEDRVSMRQMESLVLLVRVLQDYYKIPISKILGHGKVPDAITECPGTKFPWNAFIQKLKSAQ